MRPIILTGDLTSAGGHVVQGSTSTFVDGIAVARVGDAVLCIHGSCSVATGDGSTLDEGKPVARNGDVTACGATLIATHRTTGIL